MLFTWTLLLATAVISNAVPLNLVKIACERNPKLAFCDSHILGSPDGGTSPTVTSTTAIPLAGIPENSGSDDFLRWLNDEKDKLDLTIDERESHHAKHGSKEQYCAKYKANFANYCKNRIEEKLEGVLPQFCADYAQQCNVDKSAFPRPGPLPNAEKETSEPQTEEAAEPPTQVVGELPKNAATEAAESAKTADFKGGVNEYCEKFVKQFEHFCTGAERSELAKTSSEFCKSFRDSCHQSTTSAMSAVSSAISETPTKPGSSGAPEAMETMEAETEATEAKAVAEAPPQIVAELPKNAATEAAESAKTADFKGGVNEYCEKFAKQFEHFCTGAERSEFAKKSSEFCKSFRDSCHQSTSSAMSAISEESAQTGSSEATETMEPPKSSEGMPPETMESPKSSEGMLPETMESSKSSKSMPLSVSPPEPPPAPKSPESPAASSKSGTPEDIDDTEELPDSGEHGAGAQSSTEQGKQDKESSMDPKVQKYCDDFSENYNFYCAGDQSSGHEKFCRSFRTNCPHKINS